MLFGHTELSLNKIFKNDFNAYNLETKNEKNMKNFKADVMSHGNKIG